MRKLFKSSMMVAALFTATASFAQSLNVDWTWKLAQKCSTTSPVIKVDGIPQGTTFLTFDMIDHDSRGFNHGGGSVKHDGVSVSATIPEGALQNYRAACASSHFYNFGHDYEFIVKAWDESGKTMLATGSKTKTFSSKTVRD